MTLLWVTRSAATRSTHTAAALRLRCSHRVTAAASCRFQSRLHSSAGCGDNDNDKLRCVLLNAARLDCDGRINFSKLNEVACVTRFDIGAPNQVAERTKGQNVVVNKEMPLPAELIESLDDSIKLICEAGTGFNNIDLEAANSKNIQVCNVPTCATEAMAHMAVTLVMALSCSLVPQAKALGKNDCTCLQQCHLGALPHVELTQKTIGLIGGLGAIGKRVATMCQALGMRVVVSSTSQPLGMREADGVEVVSFDDLMTESDFVSIHCPLSEGAVNLVDEHALLKMKPAAFLANTARGAIVDQDALVEVLQEERIAGAALDVFGEGSAPPPALPDHHPLHPLENVVLTPHIGWQRIESRQRVVDTCADNIANIASGKPGNVDMETGKPTRR